MGQSLIKTSDVTGPVIFGQQYTVSLTICAPGAGTYVITDVLPVGITSNAQTTLTFSGTLPAAGCTTLKYIATVQDLAGICFYTNNTAYPLSMTWNGTNVSDITSDFLISSALANTVNSVLPTVATTSSLGTNVVTGKYYVVTGKLKVDQNIKFINCEFIMAPGSAIEVNPNRYLSLDGCFVHGCNTMWDAIYAQGQSSAIYLTNSRVEDARTALYMTNGSNLFSNNTIFEDNLIGIYVPPLPSLVNPVWQTVTGTIIKSSFIGGALLPRYIGIANNLYFDSGSTATTLLSSNVSSLDYSFAGVVAIHCSQLNWFSANGKNPALLNSNLFSDFHVGINVSLAADISNARFVNIRSTATYGLGIRSTAIYAMINQNLPAIPPLLTVKGFGGTASATPMFQDCDGGIYANFHALDIQNARFVNISQMAIGLECTSPSPALHSPPQVLVANNIIDVVAANGSILYPSAWGISIGSNTNINCDIRYNTIYMKRTPGIPSSLRGIEHVGTLSQKNLLIRHNNLFFKNGGTGVSLNTVTGIVAVIGGINGYSVRVAWNNIDFDTEEDFKGILVQSGASSNTAFVDVQHNTTTGRVTTLPGTGIELQLATNIRVTCNTVGRSQVGIAIKGLCNPTAIQGNDFGNHASAIRFSANGISGLQPHRGNRWNGTTTMSIEHVPATTSITLSQFTVSSALSGTPFMPAPASWSIFAPPFTPALLTSTANPALINCNSQATGVGLRPLAITALDQAVATGQYEAPDYTEETLWQMQQDLYQWLIANDSVWAGDSIITAFVDSVESTPLGELLQPVDSPVSFISPTVVAQLEALIPLIQAKEYEIFHADSLIAETPEDTLLLQNRVVLGEEYGQLLHFADSLGQIINEGSTRDADSLRARNDRVLVTEVYEQNQQTVNSIYLATYGQGISVLTPDQQAALLAIAGQCPMAGGRAVLHARGMLRYGGYDVPAYNDESLCLTQGMIWRPGKQVEEAVAAITVAPNPANEVLTLSNTTDEDAEFVLYDMAGKTVSREVVVSGETRTLQLLTFAPGVYSYAIHGSATPQVGKLVIVR